MPRKPRQLLYVNGSVQGGLLARVAMYWAYLLVAVGLASASWIMLFDRPSSPVELFSQLAFQIAPVLLATFLVLPIVLLDCVRFSNRFVGPLFRLSRAMDRLADGDRVHNIEFRQGDFWFSIAQSFNRLNERMIRLDEAAKSRQSGDQYVEAT